MNTVNRLRITSSKLTVLLAIVIAATICDEVAAVNEVAEAIQDMYAAIRTSEADSGGGTVHLDSATLVKAKYVRDSLRRMIESDDGGDADRCGHLVSKDLAAVDVQDETYRHSSKNGDKIDDGNSGFTGNDGHDGHGDGDDGDNNTDAQLDGSINRLMEKCMAIAMAKDKEKSKDQIVDELEQDFLDVVGRRYGRYGRSKKPSKAARSTLRPFSVAIDVEINTSKATTGRIVDIRRHDLRMSSAATATAADAEP